MKRKLLILVGVLLGLVAAAVIAVMILINPEDIKNEALARARDATGYAIEAGPASFKLGFSGAGIRVQDLDMASPDSSQVVTASHSDVLVKIIPLLGKRIELAKLGVSQGVYRGRGDWGALELTAVDLTGSMTWDATRGGTGSARATVGGGILSTKESTWSLPESEVDGVFAMGAGRDSVVLSNMTLTTGDITGSFQGAYHQSPTGWVGALSGKIKPFPWTSLEALLPETSLAALRGAEVSGTLAAPELNLDTGTKDGGATGVITLSNLSVRAPGAPLGLSETSGSVHFEPGRVEIRDGKGRIGEDPIEFHGAMSGDATKVLDFELETNVQGASLAKLLPPEAGLALNRGALYVNVRVHETLPFDSVPEMTGTLGITDLEGTYRQLPLRDGRGSIRLQGKSVAIEELHASLGKSDFTVRGTAPDIADPWFNFTVDSEVLDINELFPEETPGAPKGDRQEAAAIGLPGTGTVRVGTLNIRKFTFKTVEGDLRMALDGVSLKRLRGTAYGGSVTGGMTMTPVPGERFWKYDGAFDLSNVGVGELLGRWDTVGRIIDGAMNGTLTLDGKAGEGVDAKKAFNLDGDLSIREGAFRNFPALAAVSRALNLKGVNQDRWPFSALNADLQVRDGKVLLNSLDLSQVGIDWTLGGAIGLDGALALTGTLRADPSKVNLPAHIAALAPLIAESDGRIPLDFTVGGTLNAPSVGPPSYEVLERRAAERAKQNVNQEVDKILQDAIENPDDLKKLRDKLFGGKKGGGN